ncbi:hypothetical protein [Scytonema sp. PRP1]|uniref:hypothetical protein n=1 Tax=Scytonema sp. PRP1 TaxID=3120513 RepID=UPI002FD7957C
MLQILYHTFRFAIVIRAVPRAMLLYEPLLGRWCSGAASVAIAFGTIREGDRKDASKGGRLKVPFARAIEGATREAIEGAIREAITQRCHPGGDRHLL